MGTFFFFFAHDSISSPLKVVYHVGNTKVSVEEMSELLNKKETCGIPGVLGDSINSLYLIPSCEIEIIYQQKVQPY